MMRTYSGHSTAKASNELYRTNLAKGQTGLSIAFDLPTQTGYDPDHPLATGEVGKVGVPVVHREHMATLLDGIPVGEMNTSMTINATAAWLLGLYVANAENQGVDGHRRVHLADGDPVEERAHGPEVGHRHPDLADLADGAGVVGVVPGLGRQVESDRQPGLAPRQVLAVERVRLPRGRVPGIGTDQPRLIPTHRRGFLCSC